MATPDAPDPVLAAVPAQTFQPGEEVSDPQPGDFALTHGEGQESKVIRWAQRIRFRGADRTYAYYNHALLFSGTDGEIIEAQPSGVMVRNISHYTAKQYTVVRVSEIADERDREQMVALARASVGEKFAWITMLSTGVHILTGGRFAFSMIGTTLCSGLVARCLEKCDLIQDRGYCYDANQMMPADLAKLFDVKAPTS